MKIQTADITEEPKVLAYAEDVSDLNVRLGRGVRDYRLGHPLGVDAVHYRAGQDLFFRGRLRGEVFGTCARCCEEYAFPIDTPFAFVLTPRTPITAEEVELTADDLSLSFYEGKEVDLTPLVHEQVILTLPTRPLCDEGCQGLCSQCGANLNAGPCGCAADTAPRLAIVHDLVRAK